MNYMRGKFVLNLLSRNYAEMGRCQPHMNELPIPKGRWDPWYRKKQAKYTKTLITGILCVSCGIVLPKINFLWGPPDEPAPIELRDD